MPAQASIASWMSWPLLKAGPDAVDARVAERVQPASNSVQVQSKRAEEAAHWTDPIAAPLDPYAGGPAGVFWTMADVISY